MKPPLISEYTSRILKLLATSLLLLLVASACKSGNAKADAAQSPYYSQEELIEIGPQEGLTVHGYNYTDYYFYSFGVDTFSGGNLEVSTPTAGGSKSVCCGAVYPALIPYEMTVKWNRGFDDRWCEKKVMFNGPIERDPKFLEVHFYQDGHIEIAATHDYSPPKVKLPRFSRNQRYENDSQNVNNDEIMGTCKDGY